MSKHGSLLGKKKPGREERRNKANQEDEEKIRIKMINKNRKKTKKTKTLNIKEADFEEIL